MSGWQEKCTVCRALVDEEDLFCANCGAEVPDRDSVETQAVAALMTHNFGCRGCGASMSYDASAGTLRCPFCGSEKLSEQQDTRSLRADGVIPFQVTREAAVSQMRQWLGTSFWRPGNLASTASVTKIAAVYVPFWVFQARTHTYWTADSSQAPAGSRSGWYPLTGEHRGEFPGLLVGASSALTPRETLAICPFDLAGKRPAASVDLENAIVEQFRVQRKYARPQARAGFEQLVREQCQQQVPGKARHLHVNMRLEGLSSEPVLLPVWIMAYTYSGQIFRFLVNGQNGRATGQAPISIRKIAAAIGIGAGLVLGLLLLLLVLLTRR